MKLPNFSELNNEDHIFLYNHDIKEFHNPNQNSFERTRYIARINKIIEGVIRHIPPEGKIVEVGSAQSNISLLLSEMGYCVYPIDIRHSFLTYAELKYEKGKFFPICGNAEELPLKDETIQAVILAELLEHTFYPSKILSEAYRVLKKGGILCITTPNGEYIRNRLPSYSTFIPTMEKVQFLPDADGHLFAFKIDELQKLLIDNGFEILQKKTFLSPFVTGYLYFRKLIPFLPPEWRMKLEQIFTLLPFARKFTATIFIIAKKR